MLPKVSIIIPCRVLEEAEYCVEKCLELDYPNKEVIVLPDKLVDFFWYEDHLKTIPTGKCLPARKRDIGIDNALGEIIAFIDADAYPPKTWLNNAVYLLRQFHNLAGVCGAGLLPPRHTLGEWVSDYIMRMTPVAYRVINRPAKYVDDFPTFNLIFWRKHIDEVGGFKCEYLTGEDTLLCSKIIEATNKRILYSEMVAVYHHRRPVFKPFFKQIATYGLHRGYFFKKHPKTSRRLMYLIPLLIFAGVILCVICFLCWLLSRPPLFTLGIS